MTGTVEAAYEQECRQRDTEAAARNRQLQELTEALAFDVESAIQEYVGIVLSNTVYPAVFPVGHEHKFDLGHARADCHGEGSSACHHLVG